MTSSRRPDPASPARRATRAGRLPAPALVLVLVLAPVLLPGAPTRSLRAATIADDPGWTRVEAGALALEGPVSYRPLLEDLAARGRVFLPELERSLGVELAGPIVMVVIPPDPSPYPAVARLDAAAPPWAAGFAIASWRVGGLRIEQADRYPFGDPAAVLAHEVVHFLLHDAAGPGLPRWFAEGVSTREQRRWGLRDVLVYSSNLLLGPLPSLRQLDRAFSGSESDARLAYAASFDFVDWAADEYGEDVVRRVLGAARDRSFGQAWLAATGVGLTESEADWRRSSLALYRWIPVLTGAGSLWVGVTALFLVAAWRRRRRTRRLYEQWEEEDAPPRRRDSGGGWIN